MLMDPLSIDPIVVTGSANFSKVSTNDNDENMLVIRGDQRVADIYFTEFNRLFLTTTISGQSRKRRAGLPKIKSVPVTNKVCFSKKTTAGSRSTSGEA